MSAALGEDYMPLKAGEFQAFINKLNAEFPNHHVALSLFPSGGVFDVDACEECGSDESASAIFRYHRGESLDTAIVKVRAKLATAMNDAATGGEG